MQFVNMNSGSYQSRKNTLALLLAKENVNIVYQPGITTGSFDIENRTIYMPIYNQDRATNEIVDQLIGHEVGHAIHTPKNYFTSIEEQSKKYNVPIRHLHTVYNIAEDARINQLQIEKFPGWRYDHDVGYKQRWYSGDFGSTDLSEIARYSLLDRLNLHVKMRHFVDIPFHSVEEKQLAAEILNLRTWQDVENFVEKIIQHAKDETKKQKEEEKEDSGSGQKTSSQKQDEKTQASPEKSKAESNDKSESGQVNTTGQDQHGDDQSGIQPRAAENGNGDAQASAGKPDKNDAEKKPGASGTGADSGNEPEIEVDYEIFMKSLTQKMESAANESYLDKQYNEYGRHFVKIDYPSIKQDSIINFEYVSEDRDYSRSFLKWKKHADAYVNTMVSVFEQYKKAKVDRKTMINKTGKLNMAKLFAYKTSEDIFLKSEKTPDGKNHGFIFLLDTSGSMHPHMTDTYKQAALMALFAKKLKVPFVFYTFNSDTYKGIEFKSGNFYINRTPQIAKIFSSDQSNIQFIENMKYLVSPARKRENFLRASGMTPLNSSMFLLPSITQDFIKSTNIEILNIVAITDGAATDQKAFFGNVQHHNKTFVMPGFDTKNVNNLTKQLFLAMGIEKVNILNFFLKVPLKEQEYIKEIRNSDGFDIRWEINIEAVMFMKQTADVIDKIEKNRKYVTFLKKMSEIMA